MKIYQMSRDKMVLMFLSIKPINLYSMQSMIELIPSYTTLLGASLVKGIPFNPSDPEISGPDIFQRLVPMEAHEASSLYRYIRFTLGAVINHLEGWPASLEL